MLIKHDYKKTLLILYLFIRYTPTIIPTRDLCNKLLILIISQLKRYYCNIISSTYKQQLSSGKITSSIRQCAGLKSRSGQIVVRDQINGLG